MTEFTQVKQRVTSAKYQTEIHEADANYSEFKETSP